VSSALLIFGPLLASPALASEAQREVFRGFSGTWIAVFYSFAGLAVAIFLYGYWRTWAKYRRGRPAPGRMTPFFPRLAEVVRTVFSQRTVRRSDPYAGVAHALVFWGFMALIVATTLVFVDHDLYHPLTGGKFLVGPFYLAFSLGADLGGLALLVGLALLIVRRATFRLPKLDYHRVDLPEGGYDRSSYVRGDMLFAWLLVFIAVTGFLIEASRIAATYPPYEKWSIVGWTVANLAGSGLGSMRFFDAIWWVHVASVLAFIAYLPYSKATHMILDWWSLATRDARAAIALPRVADPTAPGIRTMQDFTWRQLLAFDACTKCGRCHEACPARTTNAPLSPRDLILDLREQANRTFGLHEIFGFSRPPEGEDDVVAGLYIKAETLWSCTTCRACVEVCPVGIEHVVDIVGMRRALVVEGQMPDSLQDALRSLDEKGNSFGESARKRSAWAKPLDFKIKDATKGPVDVLWFVGDFASFNQTAQEASRQFAKVLQAAGVDFGLLHKAEKSAGNDVRRAGEEGLFEVLATENIETLSGCEFDRIVTTDPHTYNTLRNEYPALGGSWEVMHYATLLLELIRTGQLPIANKAGARATYHDPCYLGRYNRGYDDPRDVLAACGVAVVEMPRNRENSFCCGAGGGRIWMPDPEGATERPSENRIREAVALGVDTFVVACPKDLTMFTDAVKTSGNEGKIVVRDLIEFVAEATAPVTHTETVDA